MRTDGSVIIDTKILDDGMEQGFERIKSDVGSVADEAKKAAQDIKAAFSQMDVSKPVADAMKKVADLERQLESVTAEHKFAISEDDDKGAERLGRKMESIYSRLEAARERLSAVVEKEAQKQAKAEERAAERSRKATEKEAKAKEKAMNKAYKAATKGARRFGSRLTEILSGALIFNAIGSGLRRLTSYFGDALKTNEQYRQSVARLKGALLTAFQPIYEYVVPAIVKLIDFLTIGAQAVARFFASLSGKSVQQMSQNAEAMYNQAKGIEQVGQEAKKAKRELMGFDELNRLSDPNAGITGTDKTGIAASDVIAPEFDGFDISKYEDKIHELITLVSMSLLALGAILTFSGANIPLGIALMAAGAIGLAAEIALNWDAVKQALDGPVGDIVALVSGSLLALGAILAFSGANIPLGIGLMAAGAVGLATSIAAKWDTIKKKLRGPIGDVVALVSTSLLALGAILAFSGVNIPLGIGLLAAGAAGIAMTASLNWDTVKGKVKSVISKIGAILSGAGIVLGALLCLSGAGIGLGLPLIAAGLAGSFAAWSLDDNPITRFVKNLANGIIRIINRVVAAINDMFHIEFKGLSIGGQLIIPQFSSRLIKIPPIPYLATGAVIPPNAPFMAVLGDQRHGTNIEAPEDLIRKIVREESGGSTEELAILRAILAATQASKNTRIYIGDNEVFQAVVDANDRATRIYGSSPLKV